MEIKQKKNRNTLVAIDIGNISIDTGVFVDGVMTRRFKEYCNSIPKYILKICLSGENTYKYAAICSVVPQIKQKVILGLRKSHIRSFSPFSGNRLRARRAIIKGAYRNLGEDRQIALWMAGRLYEPPLIVIDLGSAITIDVLNRAGKYGGGIILPGLRMWAKALNEGTALLPDVAFQGLRRVRLLGNNTEACIEAGLRFGVAAMMNGLIANIKKTIGSRNCPVILTGGDLEKVSTFLEHKHKKNDLLVLRGLYEIFCEQGEGR